jgi:hypothetical protein
MNHKNRSELHLTDQEPTTASIQDAITYQLGQLSLGPNQQGLANLRPPQRGSFKQPRQEQGMVRQIYRRTMGTLETIVAIQK